ncbi:MAG TPA: phage tail tape measure protein [Acidimicrobiales bacterium]|nr:phage tail tape measure protein [Acidimicrobiales bacterium]
MAKTRKVTVELLADESRLKRGLRKSSQELDGFGRKLKSMGKVAGVAFAAVGAGAIAAIGGLAKLGSQFDKARDAIRVGTGATGDALKALQDDFAAVAAQGPYSFEQVGDAIADLNTLTGLSGEPLQELADQFLDLSRITGVDLKGSMNSINRVFGDWGITVEDQSATMDELFRASQSTGIGIDKLADQVVQFGAPLRQMGFNFEEAAALFGKWSKEGVNTETVMSGLRRGISKFAAAGEDIPTAMRAAFEAIQSTGSASEATSLAIETFGARAGPDLAAAIREGRFEIDDLVDAIENGSDTIDAAAKDTESFGEKWATLKNRIFVGLQPLAEKIFDGMGELMDKLGPKIEVVSGWLEDHIPPALERIQEIWDDWAPKVRDFAKKTLGTLIDKFKDLRDWLRRNGDVVDGLKAALIVLGGAAVIGVVISGVQALVGAVLALNAAILANPIGVAVVALAGLAAGLTIAYQRSETFREIVNKVRDALMGAVDFVVEHWPEVQAVITDVFDRIKPIIDGFLRQLEGLKEFVVGVFTLDFDRAWGGIVDIVGGAKDIIVQHVKNLGALAKVALSGAMAGLRRIVSSGWDLLKGTVSRGVDSVVDFVTSLPGRIASAAAGAFDGITRAFKSMVNALIGAWNKLDFSISIHVPSWIPGIGGKGWDSGDIIPNIEPLSMANGGLARTPTLALVGDAGRSDPEIVSPVSMMTDIIRAELARAKPGPEIIEIRIGDHTIERVIVDALARRDRLAGTRVVT